VYTLKELAAKYKGVYSREEVKEYWQSDCIPLDAALPHVQRDVHMRREEFHFASPPQFAAMADSESEWEQQLEVADDAANKAVGSTGNSAQPVGVADNAVKFGIVDNSGNVWF